MNANTEHPGHDMIIIRKERQLSVPHSLKCMLARPPNDVEDKHLDCFLNISLIIVVGVDKFWMTLIRAHELTSLGELEFKYDGHIYEPTT